MGWSGDPQEAPGLLYSRYLCSPSFTEVELSSSSGAASGKLILRGWSLIYHAYHEWRTSVVRTQTCGTGIRETRATAKVWTQQPPRVER